MRATLLALVTLGLAAQAPLPTPASAVFDEAVFNGDRRVILQGCAMVCPGRDPQAD